jgi:hypothetical protein
VFGPVVVPLVPKEEQVGKRRWEVPYASPGDEGWTAHRGLLEARVPFAEFEFSRIAHGSEERFFSVSGEPVFEGPGRVFVG